MPGLVDSASFGRLITALSRDIVDAHVHWRLHRDVHEAIEAHPIVWQQSRTFWHLTLTAHAEASVSHLCRAFDQERSSLHLLSWLQTIQANLHLFSNGAFRERLATNPFVESLAEGAVAPDARELGADIVLCSVADPLVKRLVGLRGSAVAHTSYKLSASDVPPPTNLALSNDEFQLLLERARGILNKYSQLFSATAYSVNMIGRDDYKFIFKAVEQTVAQARRAAGG